MTFKESREYIEQHPNLAFISLDKVFDAKTGNVAAGILVAVADSEGLDQLRQLFLKLCLSGAMPSICLEPLGVRPEFRNI